MMQRSITSGTLDHVKGIVREVLHPPDHCRINEETTWDSMNADSLDRLEITIKVEHEFGVGISDNDLDKMETVGDLVIYLVGKVGSR